MQPGSIAELRRKLDDIDFVDPAIRSFKGLPLMDYGFFPGGNGLWDGVGGDASRLTTLVLGSNFGCDSKYVGKSGQLLVRDERGSSATWSSKGGLKNTLKGASEGSAAIRATIDLRECFFTNAWPFLHVGGSNDNPPIEEWLKNDNLMRKCVSFFRDQTLQTIKPNIIIALGKGPAVFLSRVWTKELKLWSLNDGTKWANLSFATLDALFHAEVKYGDEAAHCVVLTHRSKAHLNARHRRQPYSGLEGEINLLDFVASQARMNFERLRVKG